MVSAKPNNAKRSNKSSKPSTTRGNDTRQKTSRNSNNVKRPPPQQIKSKPPAYASNKSTPKKQKTYTDEELGLPALNMITPAGVQKPKGKKKGKIFVDDQESMMTILAMVNAEKEGQIESKIMKTRQMEEIRQARQKEAEARQEARKSKLEETKKSLQRKRTDSKKPHSSTRNEANPSITTRKGTKHVSFA